VISKFMLWHELVCFMLWHELVHSEHLCCGYRSELAPVPYELVAARREPSALEGCIKLRAVPIGRVKLTPW